MGSSVSEADESGRSFEVVDVDGNARRFVAADFDEVFETDDEAEMRRHLELGWVVLDEGRERGTAPRASGSTPCCAAAPEGYCPRPPTPPPGRPPTSRCTCSGI